MNHHALLSDASPREIIHPAYAVKQRLRSSCLSAVLAVILGVSTMADGAYANNVNVITDVRSDYGRILFNWDQPMRISPSSNGRELTILLERPSNVPLGRMTSGLAPYIVSGRQSPDGRTIILTMSDAFAIRHFQSGTNNGVDVLFGGRPTAEKNLSPEPQTGNTVLVNNKAPVKPISTINANTTIAAAKKPIFDTRQSVAPQQGALITAQVPSPPAVTQPQPTAPTPIPQSSNIPSPTGELVQSTLSPVSLPVVKKANEATPPSNPTALTQKPTTQPALPRLISRPIIHIPSIEEEQAKRLAAKKAVQPVAPAKQEVAEKQTAPKEKEIATEKKAPAEPKVAKEQIAPKEKEIATEQKAPAEQKLAKEQTNPTSFPLPTEKPTIQAQAQPVPSQEKEKHKLSVAINHTPSSTSLIFPFKERTAVATFSRGNETFIAFSTPTSLNLDHIASVLPKDFATIQAVDAQGGSVLRITARKGHLFTVARPTGEGYEWGIGLAHRTKNPKNLVIPELVGASGTNPQFALNFLQTAEPVQFQDPVTGETIVAIPSYEAQKGVYPERTLLDVSVLRTGQGVAFVPYDPNVTARRTRQGIRIGKEQGLLAHPNTPNLPKDILAQAEPMGEGFFPNDYWKVENIEQFNQKQDALKRAISSNDEREKQKLRLQLAQLYTSEGMHREANALLEMIARDDINFYEIQQLDALAGANYFMMKHYGLARQHFMQPTVKDEEELELWHDLLDIAEGSDDGFDYLDAEYNYLKGYPLPMRRTIGLMSAEDALAHKRYRSVQKILDHMGGQGILDPKTAQEVNYIAGRMFAELQDFKRAEMLLTPLAEQTENNRLRAGAQFALATARYKNNEITRDELINALNDLRLLWRGDAFEMQLLNTLAELETNNGEYLQALRDWKDITTYYQDHPTAHNAYKRMSETFVDLFNQHKADGMKPLDALALYYEFRELTPLGTAGDHMIQNLADKLAEVDLLDRAARLLEHQVTFRLEKEDRSRVGARLALLRLLNREPKKTLEILELTGYGDSDEELLRRRNHIAAMSYAKLGKWQRALNSLRDDFSREAKFIRTEIYWETRDWDNVALSAEDILATRIDLAQPLNDEEAEALLRLAIAYAFKNEGQQLTYLRDYFTPLLTSEEKKKTFDFLTSGVSPLSRENVTRLTSEMAKIKSFLDNYRMEQTNQDADEKLNEATSADEQKISSAM